MQDRLKIGEIKYANCTPVYATLKKQADCSGYEFIAGEPAALNALLASGKVDVSSSSSIEYARHWKEYLVVPGISISSKGEVGSILLFSRKPVEGLDGEIISVSSASATSTILLKALLKFRYGMEAPLVPKAPVLHEMLDGAQAALLIGDEALRERKLNRFPELRVYDLGRMWQDFTGLPFVYALWMVREDSVKRLPELAQRFKSDILDARETACGSYEEIAKGSPETSWMGTDGLLAYWRAISYDLGGEHVKGMMRYFEFAAELGEIPEKPSLRLL